MSAFLSDVADFVGLGPELDALRDLLGLQGLKPGSFRGVPFHVADNDRAGGRRVGVTEYPLRDDISTEDLGRAKREFTVTAYVIGEDWRDQRDELLFACEDVAKPGTLTLPFGFEMVVRCTNVRVQETQVRNVCTFLLSFVDAGGDQPGVAKRVDPASLLRNTVGRALRLARAGFALAYATKDLGDFVQRAALSGLAGLGAQLAGAWLGLPGLDLSATARAIGGLDDADAEDPVDAVCAPSRALADAALALPAAASVQGGEAVTSRAEPAPSRRDVALALLRVASAPVAQPVVGPGVIAQRVEANRRALDALNRDTATLMAAEVLSATDFPSLAEAEQLRGALLDAIDIRAEVAADAGDDDAFRGWRELAAAASRAMAERARRAPRLAAYALPAGRPSLALAQRLYGDAGRAEELVLLNDVPHPAFMPAAGKALRP